MSSSGAPDSSGSKPLASARIPWSGMKECYSSGDDYTLFEDLGP